MTWTAGVTGRPVIRALGVPGDRLRRVKVEPDLSIPGHAEFLVAGDLMVMERNGKLFSPGLAPAPEPFRYWNKGNLAMIGRTFAIADLGRRKLSGLPAWLLWLTVHIPSMTNLWNRIQEVNTCSSSATAMDRPTWYELRVQGHLDARWSAWFDGMSIRHDPDGTTTLHGPVVDQAALYGLISKVRDLGLTLLGVTQRPPTDGRI